MIVGIHAHERVFLYACIGQRRRQSFLQEKPLIYGQTIYQQEGDFRGFFLRDAVCQESRDMMDHDRVYRRIIVDSAIGG